MAKAKLPLIRVVNKIPGNQDVVIRHYLTGSWQEHTSVNNLIERLHYMQETREAEVYGISYDINEQAMIIDILEV
jgi:hypothetical protein